MEYDEGKKKNIVDQILLSSFFFCKIAIIYNVLDFPYVILFTPDIKPMRRDFYSVNKE